MATRTFTVDGQKVDVVRKYKYLGIWITDRLGDSEQTDETNHCKMLAGKVKVAIDMRRAFLRDKKFPMEVKLAVIQSKIISLGLYGGEWVGMCQRRTNIIQKEVNVALKLILGSSSNSTMHAYRITAWELGLPTIEERMADLRMRLWQKAPTMKSWISVLVADENRLKCRGRPWSGQTAHMVKSALNRYGLGENMYQTWQYKTLQQEGKVKYYPQDRSDETSEQKLERRRQELKLHIIRRSFENAHDSRNEATNIYRSCLFGKNRRYIRNAAHMPSLNEGIIWLARIRTSAWWTSRRRRDFLKNTGGDYSHLLEDTCPCCGEEFKDNRYEIHHILYDCPMWNTERKQWLTPLVNILKGVINRGQGRSHPTEPELAEAEMTACILGGSFDPDARDEIDISGIFINWGNRGPIAGALQLFEKGWGGQSEYYTPGFSTHLYIPVAKFLSKVMPKHKARLFLTGKANTDPIAYARLSTAETAENRCKRWASTQHQWTLDDGGEHSLRVEPTFTNLTPPGVYQANVPVWDRALFLEDASERSESTEKRSFHETGTDHC
ncbi:hypothetical protein BU15DRAFT_69581 [Melanogaster broomeanus]|nr:hypothetical protein BU15DRAFT_69581 [Melanogaster broomeanus]